MGVYVASTLHLPHARVVSDFRSPLLAKVWEEEEAAADAAYRAARTAEDDSDDGEGDGVWRSRNKTYDLMEDYRRVSTKALRKREREAHRERVAARRKAVADAIQEEEDRRIGIEEAALTQRRLARRVGRDRERVERGIENIIALESTALHAIRTAAQLRPNDGSVEREERDIFDSFVYVKEEPTVWMAAMKNDVSMLRKLVERKKIHPDTPDPASGETALFAAIRGGHVEMAEYLLEKGADASYKDNMGSTPLHMAAMYALPEVFITQLLDRGARIDAADKFASTPLMAAISAAQIDSVAILLRLGADSGRKNSGGETAFDMAVVMAENQVNDVMRSKYNVIKDMLRPLASSSSR